jgi:uncharacterized RDD family membrane protein YckC
MTTDEIIDAPDRDVKIGLSERGTRFGNYLIDAICFIVIIILHSLLFDLFGGIPEGGSDFLVIYSVALRIFYYALFEYFFLKTPGKFLTRTHVETMNGKRLTFGRATVRSLCRLIPFDNVSFLFSRTGWHDQISGTCVIDDD